MNHVRHVCSLVYAEPDAFTDHQDSLSFIQRTSVWIVMTAVSDSVKGFGYNHDFLLSHSSDWCLSQWIISIRTEICYMESVFELVNHWVIWVGEFSESGVLVQSWTFLVFQCMWKIILLTMWTFKLLTNKQT